MANYQVSDQIQGVSTPIFIDINSTQRDNFPTSSSTNFRLKLQTPIQSARNITLVQANIPFTWNIFNSSATAAVAARVNNHIRFVDSGGLPLDAQITPGSYNINELMTEMKTQMEAVSVDTFTFSYSLTTLILTISSSSPNFQLLFAPIAGVSDTLWYEIGFDNVDTAVAATQVGVRPVYLAGPPNLYIKLPQIRQPLFDTGNLSASFTVQNNAQNYGDIIRYTEQQGYNSEYNITFQNITYINVTLTSDFGPITFNSDWNMILKFT